ncbi:MAG: Fe-S cluster assembly protein SufD [Acidimicrobiales bacterium]
MSATARAATARRPLRRLSGMPVMVPDRAWEPGWLRVARRQAAEWVQAHGFPTTKHEDWRYTKIDAVLDVPLGAAPTADTAPTSGGAASADGAPSAHTALTADGTGTLQSVRALLDPGLGGTRVVVVNGRVVRALSSTFGSAPAGARLETLDDAVRPTDGDLEQLWSWRGDGYPHALRALNDAAALDALVVSLHPGAVVAEPIEIVIVSAPAGTPRWSHPRVLVQAGEGARATLVETYVSVGGPSVTNALTQVRLDAGAVLDHYVLQDERLDCFHFSSLEARLGDRSRLSSRVLSTGGRIGRHEVDVVFSGETAELAADGLFLTGSGQLHDNPVLVDHAATGCTSRQLYKGIVSGDGKGVFNGHIVVRPGADGTDAAQVNKNLLLSERAEVDTRPRLEINASDVACTHGAAVGQLDPDALFYLRSRGIDASEARAVLVSGFAREVLDRFGRGPVRRRADQLAIAAGLVTLDDRRDELQANNTFSTEAVDAHDGGPRT